MNSMSDFKTGNTPCFPTENEAQTDDFTWRYEGLTQRQYAAIKLRVPDSGEDWLNAMILKSLRNEFASKAIQGAMEDTDINYIDLASMFKLADAMIAESAK